MNKYHILLGFLTRILATPARSETRDVGCHQRAFKVTLRVYQQYNHKLSHCATQGEIAPLSVTFPVSVTNGSALAGPSWHRWEPNNVQCFSCISLFPKPQLLHSSPLYFLKWTKGDYAATQIRKYHHVYPLMWKYAMPWCWEVTHVLMNSLQDFQCDYFSPDHLRLRGKSSERNKTKLWKFSAVSKGKCTFDNIPS